MKKYLVLSLFLLATTASASSDCGTITGPEGLNNGAPLTTVPIENCTDPFGVTFVPSNPYTLHINDTVVANNDTYTLDEEGETNLRITGQSHQSDYFSLLFKHTNDGYEYIDRSIPEPTHSDEIAYLNTYFQTESERTRYGKILSVYQSGGDTEPFFYNEAIGEDILDIDTGEYVSDRFFDFLNSFYDFYYNQSPPPLNPGTYTLVLKEYELILNQHSFFQKLAHVIIPKAEANCDYCTPPYIYTITFTILPYEPTPTGASSVLFLPGIQASRLYVGEDGAGVEAGERVWEPGNNDDIRSLEMSANGVSKNNIYATDIIDNITTDIILNWKIQSGSVYAGISNFLDSLVTEDTISEWRPYAYDWRYDVFDIVRDGTKIDSFGNTELLFDTVLEMASTSLSKKVTLVAHSNGGLVAKALIQQLESLGREDLVDKVIFIGSPHLGAPKAVGSLLHGYDQELLNGIVGRQSAAREIINNLPGAYGLLPAEEYINRAGTPIIVFDNSASTQSYRDDYGTGIDTYQEYIDFMSVRHQSNPLNVSLKTPVSINKNIFDEAMTYHNTLLDNFIFPGHIKVYNVIGTGVSTPIAMRYAGLYEEQCRNNPALACLDNNGSVPLAILSLHGDGTVTDVSASGVNYNENYYVDLKRVSESTPGKTFTHSNLTETDYVQHLLHSFILNTTPNQNNFISSSRPIFEEKFTIQAIASPVQISAIDKEGRQTGVVWDGYVWREKKDIPGSDYFELAGVKYLIIPRGTEVKTILVGTGDGVFTYIVSELSSDSHIETHFLPNATSTVGMTITLPVIDGEPGDLSVDLNSDNEIDYTISIDDGSIIYDDTRVNIETPGKSSGTVSFIARPTPKVAGVSTTAESEYLKQIYILLLELQNIINKYQKN